MEYNIYCDESCHLEHDSSDVMSLGALWCPKNKVTQINRDIIAIKKKHGIHRDLEVKWSKIGPAKAELYYELIDYMLSNRCIKLRGIVIDKTQIDLKLHRHTHNEWYHKMYYDLLNIIFNNKFDNGIRNTFNVYADIKDKNSTKSFKRLYEICEDKYNRDFLSVQKITIIQSKEIQIMQLVDLFTGALVYKNRIFNDSCTRSDIKKGIVKKIIEYTGFSLSQTTTLYDKKLTLLVWPNGRIKETNLLGTEATNSD